MRHVVTYDEFWIDRNSLLSVSIIDNRGQWCGQVSVSSRDAAGLMQVTAAIPFGLEHLARFNDATAKALRGAMAREIIPSGDQEHVP